MQKICKFEALYRSEIQCILVCNCHKYSPQKVSFVEDTCFTRNICKYRFKKKICLKITKILDVENVIYIFVYNFANVGMKPECKG